MEKLVHLSRLSLRQAQHRCPTSSSVDLWLTAPCLDTFGARSCVDWNKETLVISGGEESADRSQPLLLLCILLMSCGTNACVELWLMEAGARI